MENYIERKRAEFLDRFVKTNRSSKTGVWWKIPLIGQEEVASPAEVESFFTEALTGMAEELEGEIAQLRQEPTLCGKCNFNSDLCSRCYANRRANATLDNVLAIITRYKKGV